ncbi:MAG: hypothetical protein AAGE03_07415 [Pseudomonadota bacterium]
MMDVVMAAPGLAGDAATQIEAVLRSMELARTALDEAVQKLNAGGKAEDVGSTALAVSRAQTVVANELRRIEDAQRIERGGDGLDLDAARLEIGRRLDCILAAGDAGAVPE